VLYKTTEELLSEVAVRFKKIRKIKKISQQELSKISNVSYGTIKRFENKGEISLHSLTMLCVALDIEYEITNLFKKVVFNNIDEVIEYGKA